MDHLDVQQQETRRVLAVLERLGESPRNLANLTVLGLGGEALKTGWAFIKERGNSGAETLLKYPAGLELPDDLLLEWCVKGLGCLEPLLVESGLFLTRWDYLVLFHQSLAYLEGEIQRLQEGEGEEKWGPAFRDQPHDKAMAWALNQLWVELFLLAEGWLRNTPYLKRQTKAFIRHMRRPGWGETPPHPMFQRWAGGRLFGRQRLHQAVERFQGALEFALRGWVKSRKNARWKFEPGGLPFTLKPVAADEVSLALAFLGLNQQTATPAAAQAAFRQLSKRAHPDLGGSKEDFLHLSWCKERVEKWLGSRQNG